MASGRRWGVFLSELTVPVLTGLSAAPRVEVGGTLLPYGGGAELAYAPWQLALRVATPRLGPAVLVLALPSPAPREGVDAPDRDLAWTRVGVRVGSAGAGGA